MGCGCHVFGRTASCTPFSSLSQLQACAHTGGAGCGPGALPQEEGQPGRAGQHVPRPLRALRGMGSGRVSEVPCSVWECGCLRGLRPKVPGHLLRVQPRASAQVRHLRSRAYTLQAPFPAPRVQVSKQTEAQRGVTQHDPLGPGTASPTLQTPARGAVVGAAE